MMKKYWRIAKMALEEHLVYRLNIFLWRFRNVVFLFSLIVFWQAVFAGKGEIFGYQKQQLFTYVIGASILKALVFSSRVADLAGMIKSGEVVHKFLLKPWQVIGVFFSRDLAVKLTDIFFTLAEAFVLIKLMRLPVYWPEERETIWLFSLSCFLAIFLFFFLSFLLSLTAFWVDNVWAPRWLFGAIFLNFFAGAFFPLDILPRPLFQLINLTPFPYLVYFPLKIYLGQLKRGEIYQGMFLLSFWLVFFVLFTRWAWQKGLKNYSPWGG